jgi:hypothetical protein
MRQTATATAVAVVLKTPISRTRGLIVADE